MSKSKLGRGLEYLIEQNGIDFEDENNIQELSLSQIKPNPFQPRHEFNDEKLEELAQSIKEHGVFQPILVRQGIIDYEIISGERRYRAAILADKKTIPAIVYDFTDEQMIEVGIVENIQREDLSPIEEARAYESMMEKLQITQEEVAQKVGKSRSYIANKIRLLDLDEYILDGLAQGKITDGHAKRLASVEDAQKRQQMFDLIINDGLSVRDLEESTQGLTKQTKNKVEKSQEYKRLEKEMRNKLNTRVKISGQDKGKLIIHYSSKENLEELLEKLNLI